MMSVRPFGSGHTAAKPKPQISKRKLPPKKKVELLDVGGGMKLSRENIDFMNGLRRDCERSLRARDEA